jgi:hypothetical protein
LILLEKAINNPTTMSAQSLKKLKVEKSLPGIICGGLSLITLVVYPKAFFGFWGITLCVIPFIPPKKILNISILLTFLGLALAIGTGNLLPIFLTPLGFYFLRKEWGSISEPPSPREEGLRELKAAKKLHDAGIYTDGDYAAASAKINREYGGP